MPLAFILLAVVGLIGVVFAYYGPAEATPESPPSPTPGQEFFPFNFFGGFNEAQAQPVEEIAVQQPVIDENWFPTPVSTEQDTPSATGPGWLQELFSFGTNAVTVTPEAPTDDLTGTGLPDWQRVIIVDTAKRFSIDARLLAALRKAENGRPGRDFGVLSIATYQPKDTSLPELQHAFQDQATIAARTIANNLTRYRANIKQEPIGPDGRVTSEFITYFSNIYAPSGVANDPTNLNQFHVGNLKGYYAAIDYA